MNSDGWIYLISYMLVIAACAGQIVYLIRKDSWFGGAARWCGLLAALGIVGGLAWRGASQGYWPPVSSYESALMVAVAMLLLYWPMQRRAEGQLGLISLILTLALLSCLWLLPAEMRAPMPPTPLWRSGWHILHALCAAMGYGALAVAGGMGAAYLLSAWHPGWGRWLISAEALDEAASDAMRLALPVMTLSVVGGAIWALLGWGAFWRWEARETWALIIWLICLLYAHARGLPGWSGRRTALVSVVGLVVVAFVLFGADWLAQWTRIEILPMR